MSSCRRNSYHAFDKDDDDDVSFASSTATNPATVVTTTTSGAIHVAEGEEEEVGKEEYFHDEDLLTVFQAAPLAYVDHQGTEHAMKVLDFEFERQLLTKTIHESLESSSSLGCSSSVSSSFTPPLSPSSSPRMQVRERTKPVNYTKKRRIHLKFEIAVTDRLSAFLAEDKGQILHFSCHGHPKYLALEDGWGQLQSLGVNELRSWIALGGKNLRFVFVSACYSSFIGQAFVDAGVKHVVCCGHDSRLREVAAGKTKEILRWHAKLYPFLTTILVELTVL